MSNEYSFNLDNEPVIMGILNVTPDSFSDGGKYTDLDSALIQAEKMMREGAKIIDVGGESTRPGYQPISVQEEIERVVPVIQAIKDRLPVPISIDTYKPRVARAALDVGADMLNDIWGLKGHKAMEFMGIKDNTTGLPFIKTMAKIAAESGAPVVIGHNRLHAQYENFMEDMLDDIRESIDMAHQAGVKDSQIILDPNIGFAKNYNQNLYAINHVDKLRRMGYPVLLGVSRKSVIRKTLNTEDPNILGGSVAGTVIGLERGCRIFRVHDVKENYQAMMMAWKLMNSQRY